MTVVADARHPHRPQTMSAQERARMHHELHRLLAAAVPLGVSINDDWANLATDVPDIVAELNPLLVGVQEGFRVAYRDKLGDRWGVRQREDNDATAGVALIFDRHRLHGIGRRHDRDPGAVGHGWKVLGQGSDTRERGVLWDDLEVNDPIPGVPDRFRAASWHRPPERDAKSWPEFDRHAVRWLHQSPLPVIVFQDSNEPGGPADIMDQLGPRYGWHAHGRDIDGAIAHEVFGCGSVVLRPRESSDHMAAVVPLGVAA